jgi:hypothetical protein
LVQSPSPPFRPRLSFTDQLRKDSANRKSNRKPNTVHRNGVAPLDSRPRHRDRRRPKPSRQRSLTLAVSVASSNRADTLRWCRTRRALQLLIDDGLDRRPNPLPHQLLERPFSTHRTPAIALRGVILRHPSPSGRELGSTRRILTPFHFSTNFATLATLSLKPRQ